MTEDGILIIQSKRYRTQDQNRADEIYKINSYYTESIEST